MISHVYIGITDFQRALGFYSAVMDILGHPLKFSEPEKRWAAWKPMNAERPLVIIGMPYDGSQSQAGNGQMIALIAPCRTAVREAHDIAIAHGGQSEGLPGLRPRYHADFYGAYVRDHDGNKICVCCHHAEPA